MKIVHFLLGRTNPESANGIDKTVYFLAQTQASLGHDVTVFSITHLPPLPIPGADVRVYAPRRLPRPPFARSSYLPRRDPLRLPKGMLPDLLRVAPDIVHFHSVHVPEAVWVARRLRRARIPYCVTPHGALAMQARTYRRQTRKKVFSALFEHDYLQRALFLHAVSKGEAEDLRSQRHGTRVVLARNCIDAALVPNRPDAEALSRRFPQLRGRRVLTYLGRLDPDQKGLDLLLLAWARIARSSDMRLLLVGPDWRGGQATLQALADRLGVTDTVTFAPPVSGDEKWSVFAGSDFFLHPSRWEGAPFTVLEAMAAGKPVLASAAADPDGFIRTYEAGFIVPIDVADLAAALQGVAGTSDEELQRMGANARRLVEREFRWDDTAKILVDAYGAATREAFGPGA